MQLSPTPDYSTARYPFHYNNATNSPRKPKRIQNDNQFSNSPKVTTKYLISTVTTNRRSHSVQTQSKQKRIVNNRNVVIDKPEYSKKKKIQKLWKLLSQHLRRSKQRIVLFHSSRKIRLENNWKSLARILSHRDRIFNLKVKIFKAAFIIVNQIFTRNRISNIPSSYVSKQLLYKLHRSSISFVLSELINLYYNRRINKEKGITLSIAMPDVNIDSEMDTLISHSKMYELIHKAFMKSPFEIRENDIDYETVEELIPIVNFNSDTKKVSGNPDEVLANLIRLTRKDIRLAVNDRIVTDLVQDVFDQIGYPITLNTPDDDAIRSIVSFLTVEDSLSFVSQPNVDSIYDITQKDMKIYVNKRKIGNIITSMINKINIPIVPNAVNDLTAREIVDDDNFDEVIESELTIPYINKDYEMSDNKSKLVKMLNYTPVDVRMYFSGRFVDDMIGSLFDQVSLKLPITSNRPSDETCREIIDIDEYNIYPFGDYVENEKEVESWIDPVSRYETKDIKLYVNRRVISRVVGKLFSQIKNSLPIVPNTVDQSVIDEIVSMPIEDSFTTLPICKNESINDYTAKDIQLYVNDRIIDQIMNDTYNSFSIPIVPNKVTRQQVKEILEDDFKDIMPDFSNADEWIDPLLNIDPNNRKISLDKSVVSRTVNRLLSKSIFEIPIVPNTVDDETAYEILDCSESNCDKFEKESIQTIDPLVDVSSLSNMEPTDMRMYVNQRILDDIVFSILDETPIPVTLNDVDETEVKEIVNTDLADSFLSLPFKFAQPIDVFQPKDIQLYVNDRIVDSYVFQMFDTLKIPLTNNEVDQKDIDEILEEEDYMDGVPPMIDRSLEESLTPLFDGIDPLERRINFNFPINPSIFAHEAILDLPLCSNEVTDSEIDSILTYFNDKVTFKRPPKSNEIELNSVLPLDDADPLKRYIAPVEVFESIDDVVERIMNRILANEVFPSIPVEPQVVVENDTANAILSYFSKNQPNSTLIDQKSIFTLLMTEPKTVFNVEPLEIFDAIEQPVTITPDEILDGILWHEVLQKLPLTNAKKKIIDFDDVVDQIVIDNYIVTRDEPVSTDSDNNRSVKSNKSNKSNKSSKSSKSGKSDRSTKSAAEDFICNCLTDSSELSDVDENLPYLMTSPSNPSSPTASSPAFKSQPRQQYFKSLLDTSSESFIADDDNNNNNSRNSIKHNSSVIKSSNKSNNLSNSSSSKKKVILTENKIKVEKKIIVQKNEEEEEFYEEDENAQLITNVEDTNNDSMSFSFEGAPEKEIKNVNIEIENIIEEEEEEQEEIVVDLNKSGNDRIETIEKTEKKVSFIGKQLIIEEEEEDKIEIDIDVDFDVDLNDDNDDVIKDFIDSHKEEEDNADLLSDDFSD